MKRLSLGAWLALALIANGVGGVVWLALKVRNDERRAAMRVDHGDTVTIEYNLDDPHDFTPDERAAIADEARRAFPAVRSALPQAPASIVLNVTSAPPDKVLPETGEAAYIIPPNIVTWRVDTRRKEGVVAIVRTQLRPLLFHETHNLVRSADIAPRQDIREKVVCEGLATAFERDYGLGGAAPLWGQYPVDVEVWAREVLALPKDAPTDVWMRRHPDGRRWLGIRVGTFLADCATRASGKTSAELASVPAETVLAMCPAVAALRDAGAPGLPNP